MHTKSATIVACRKNYHASITIPPQLRAFSVPIESERRLYFLFLTPFLQANRCPLRRTLRWKTRLVINQTREPFADIARFVEMTGHAGRAPAHGKRKAAKIGHDRKHAFISHVIADENRTAAPERL